MFCLSPGYSPAFPFLNSTIKSRGKPSPGRRWVASISSAAVKNMMTGAEQRTCDAGSAAWHTGGTPTHFMDWGREALQQDTDGETFCCFL